MSAGQVFVLIPAALYGLGVWMAYTDGKIYWVAVLIMGGAAILGLCTGSLARLIVDTLRGVS